MPIIRKSIQHFRGLLSRLPILKYGEVAFTTDEKAIYVGGKDGKNVRFANESDVATANTRIQTIGLIESHGHPLPDDELNDKEFCDGHRIGLSEAKYGLLKNKLAKDQIISYMNNVQHIDLELLGQGMPYFEVIHSCWSEQQRKFVALILAEAAGREFTAISVDGTNWSFAEFNEATPRVGLEKICWSEKLSIYVTVGVYGNVIHFHQSSDGVQWVRTFSIFVPTSISHTVELLWCQERNEFIAVFSRFMTSYKFYKSSDGTNWALVYERAAAYTSAEYGAGNAHPLSICWSPKRKQYAMVGYFEVVRDGDMVYHPYIGVSSNGISWTERILPLPILDGHENVFQPRSICWSEDRNEYLAVGLARPIGSAPSSQKSIAMLSNNGTDFSYGNIDIDTPDNTVNASFMNVVWIGEIGRYVAGGGYTYYVYGESGATFHAEAFIYYSLNGKDWELMLINDPILAPVNVLLWSSSLKRLLSTPNDTYFPTAPERKVTLFGFDEYYYVPNIYSEHFYPYMLCGRDGA